MTQKSLQLNKPQGFLSQPFAKNYNSYYKEGGLKGHTGEDYVNGWKSEIVASTDGLIYSVKEPTSDTEKYSCVYQLIDTPDFAYEVSYGHIAKSFVKKGQMVKAGDKIALEGNFGACYRGGKRVTPAEKKLGWGSHLHFQVRKCKRVPKRERGKTYLRDDKGYYRNKDREYYEVVNYENGYNGCVDPELFYPISSAVLLKILLLLKKLGILK